MAWKYVIMRVGNNEVPIIFPEHLVHSAMADALRDYYAKIAQTMSGNLLSPQAIEKLKQEIVPVSAGEVRLDVGPCSGRSETLGVEAREDDGQFLNSYNYHHGYVPESE